jgi:CRISPR system Cascade subunit CasD
MMPFLACSIYAPLASWGDVAVGSVRRSLDVPTRSAVLGLVGAAVGIARDDRNALEALDAGYGVGVIGVVPGAPTWDYHTASTVAAGVVKRKAPRSRRELLSLVHRSAHETVLSRRQLRQDHLAIAVLWTRPQAPWPLPHLVDALARPTYTLYAGRKANALALPLAPRVYEAASLGTVSRLALDDLRASVAKVGLPLRLPGSAEGLEVYHDALDMAGSAEGLRLRRIERRRVRGRDRLLWQFAEHETLVSQIAPGAA